MSSMSLSKSSSKLLSPRPSKKEKDSVPNQTDINNLALDTPVLKGYMYKKSHHSFDSFNKRYFALYSGCLVYYRKEDEYKKDLGNHSLKNRAGYITLNRVYLSKPDKKPQGGRYCFVLHTPDPANARRETLLVCKTREERAQWMVQIQAQNPHLIAPGQRIAPDTPIPERRRAHSVPSNSAMMLEVLPNTLSSTPSFDEVALKVEDGDSDRESGGVEKDGDEEEEEEDNDVCVLSFDVPETGDIQLEVPSTPPVTVT